MDRVNRWRRMRAEGRTELPGDAPAVESTRRTLTEAFAGELDMLFGPARRHVNERREWVAVAKIDDREAGAGPIDLSSGKVSLGQYDRVVGPAGDEIEEPLGLGPDRG
jgi:hypothetical protein